MLTLAPSVGATLVIAAILRGHNERKVAEQIARGAGVMNYHEDAFRQLAIARVPIRVARTRDLTNTPTAELYRTRLWP